MTNLFRISSRKRGPTYKRRVFRLQIPQGQSFTKPAIPLQNILVGKISMIQRGSLATSPIRFSQRRSEVNNVFETCGISQKWLHRTPLMVSQLWFNYQLIHNDISRLGEIASTLYTSVIMPLGSYMHNNVGWLVQASALWLSILRHQLYLNRTESVKTTSIKMRVNTCLKFLCYAYEKWNYKVQIQVKATRRT